MTNARRYKVLVGHEVVFCGSWRTASLVFDAVRTSLNLAGALSAVSVTLAFDL